MLELTPDLVGPSVTRNSGIIGEGVDLSLEHLDDMRQSSLVFQESGFVPSAVQDATADRACQRVLSLFGDGSSGLTLVARGQPLRVLVEALNPILRNSSA